MSNWVTVPLKSVYYEDKVSEVHAGHVGFKVFPVYTVSFVVYKSVLNSGLRASAPLMKRK